MLRPITEMPITYAGGDLLMAKTRGGSDMDHDYGKCNICNEVYTTVNVEVAEEIIIFVCSECIDKAKGNFIWLCLSCGKTYIRPKDLVINKIKDHELKRAYMLCEDMQIIQGIEMCISCSPERIIDYMEMHQIAMEC